LYKIKILAKKENSWGSLNYLKGIKFRGFHGFWTNPRKLVPAKNPNYFIFALRFAAYGCFIYIKNNKVRGKPSTLLMIFIVHIWVIWYINLCLRTIPNKVETYIELFIIAIFLQLPFCAWSYQLSAALFLVVFSLEYFYDSVNNINLFYIGLCSTGRGNQALYK